MRKTKLSKQDVEIGERLRLGREMIGLTQEACALQLGLHRTTLANYEACRTPVRFEIALRFCRQFIISEEWLATGKFDSFKMALREVGIPSKTGTELSSEFDALISIRQCMDLWSDPISRHIKPGTLFSDAYSSGLAQKYADTVRGFTHRPVLKLSEMDQHSSAENYLSAIHKRHVFLLCNEAQRKKINPSDYWRVYTIGCIEVCELVWSRLMGFPSPEGYLEEFGWLQMLLNDDGALLPPMKDGFWDPPVADVGNNSSSGNLHLMTVYENNTFESVTPSMPELLDRLKTATEEHGKKSELAAFIGVAHSTISVWLSGKQEPGGSVTLQLLQWVQNEESSKSKSSSHARTRPEQRTQSRNRDETKSKPSPR